MRTKRLAIPMAAAAAALGLAACGSSDNKKTTAPTAATTATTTAAATAGKVGIVLKEFTLTPTPTSAKAGKVTFAIANNGQVKHEFVVIKTDKQAGDLGEPNGEASEKGSVGEAGDIQPGAKKTLVLDLKAGHYALICNLPGHYKAGQYANFSVTS